MKSGQSIAPVSSASSQKKDWLVWFFGPVCLGLLLVVAELIFEGAQYTNNFNRGVYYLKRGDNLMARIEFNQCITKNPVDARAHLYRAIANERMDQHDAAIADYSKVIDLDARNLLAYIGRATSLEKLQQYKMAIASCNAALKLDNSCLDAYRVRSLAFNFANDFAEAIKDCNYFLERHKQMDKSRAEVLSTRAMAFLHMKNYDAAITDLTESIACSPDDGLLYLNRAVVFKETNDYKKAIADCNSAQKRIAGNLSVYSIRSACYEKIGDIKAALADVDHLTAMSPSIETHRKRGRARLALHDYSGALEDFEWILRTAPQDGDANRNRDAALSAIKQKP